MQLSSRILTALAVLILSVAVLTLRGVSPEGVEAATGTIDVLNVGTCYTTNDDVFSADNCVDGDTTAGYKVGGRDSISEVGTVYATYSHDPKTAADSPRGILQNADLVKISIQDTDRDKRTPVLLPVGTAPTGLNKAQYDAITKVIPAVKITADTNNSYPLPDLNMYWGTGSYADYQTRANVPLSSGVKNGLTVLRPTTGPEYKPMDVADNADIKFFGCVEGPTQNDNCGEGEPFKELTSGEIRLDEDRGSGRTSGEPGGAVAPWLNLLVDNAKVHLMYIVYHTSESETLIGGKKMGDYGSGTDQVNVDQPYFTASEKTSESALVVRVKSDGDGSMQNLWLKETNRFSGRYEGYARLTDADGDGTDGAGQDNWGLDVKAANSEMPAGAAVIGVESGPLVVEYKDTDGKVQTLTVSIDTVSPSVNIDTPAHKAQDQDTSPEFSGSFNDAESGLRAGSFAFYVDNSNDTMEDGNSGTPTLDLTLGHTKTANGITTCDGAYGCVDQPGTSIRSVDEYTGYTANSTQFGVLPSNKLYGLEDATRKPVKADSFDDGDTDGTFADSVRIRIEDSDDNEIDPYNNTIDYQGLVADIAGNVGFSDSDPDGPRFINDYGDTGDDRKTGRYNVLGWYARHVFFLDEKPPEIYQEQSVTGFYGVDDNGKPVVNRSGVLVAFDAAVDSDTVSTATFDVTLDAADAQSTPAMATVTDVNVVGRQVYLLLDNELASNATPSVRVAAGQSITDPAGNRYTRGDAAAFDVKDGIAPKLTVTLSGGSGTGTGGEASDMLTNKSTGMIIRVGSDEEIQNTPSLTVVCSNINWSESGTGSAVQKDLSEFTGDRSGPLMDASAVFALDDSSSEKTYTATTQFMCGDNTTKRNLQQVQTFSRPGLEWEYQWQDFSGDRSLRTAN